MRTFLFAIIAVFACYALADSLNSVNMPAVFWSGREYFAGKGVEVLSSINEVDVEASLDQIAHTSKLNYVSSLEDYIQIQTQTPELLVLFVTSKLRTEQLTHYSSSLSQLKGALSAAQSSLIVPYAFTDVPFADPLLRHLAAAGSTVLISANSQTDTLVQSIADKDNVQFALLSELESTLQTQQAIFTNGVTDVLVVVLNTQVFPEDLSNADALIGKVDTIVRKQTSGNYVALFTSNAPALGDITKTFAAPQKRSTRMTARSNVGANFDDSDTYWPHTIYEAIVVMVVLLIILYAGLACLCSVDTPQRFEGGAARK